ncbi:MAG: hypothetical protein HN353_03100 [Bdellovibrionales bacterium]|jgi:hypothetical protein|nr:hypothetical protein [Bdellovibrionales bacterium]MBT3527106.1 hypothetical protein [Bdellovibrionales bacterium]MBT7766312.1 hypothetical protein [Bdellovibrionales bacterium]
MPKIIAIFATVALMLTPTSNFARDYIIFSITQSVPMGEPNEIIKKNFYTNLGQEQGVDKGTILDVFRTISRSDPYQSKKRYNYRIKIGELSVLHAEQSSSIGKISKVNTEAKYPLFEIEAFTIGDHVTVHIKDE